jgi:hypothetical protein
MRKPHSTVYSRSNATVRHHAGSDRYCSSRNGPALPSYADSPAQETYWKKKTKNHLFNVKSKCWFHFWAWDFFLLHADKKENKIFLIYKEIQRDRVQSHIWLTASSYMGKNLRVSAYTYDLASDPICISLYMRKVLFSFYQCIVYVHFKNSANPLKTSLQPYLLQRLLKC